MIVVCELLPSGGVKRHEIPAVPNPLGWALAQGSNWRQVGTTRIWIERTEYPASFPTIEMQQRWQLRAAGLDGKQH